MLFPIIWSVSITLVVTDYRGKRKSSGLCQHLIKRLQHVLCNINHVCHNFSMIIMLALQVVG